MAEMTSDINSAFLPGANTKLLKEAMSLVPAPIHPPTNPPITTTSCLCLS